MDGYYEYRNAKNKQISIILIIVILLTSVLTASAALCKHESVEYIVTIEPTCTEKGEGKFICNDCNAVLEVYLPSAVGHNFEEYVVTAEPAKNANGEESANCTRCNAVDKREFICPHSELIDHLAIEPSCTEQGRMDTICARCETVITENVVDAIGHNVEAFVITVKPTAEENGVQEGTCTSCGETISKEYVCTHEETNEVLVQSATCQEHGKVNIVCEMCEKILCTNLTDTVDCSYGNWEIFKAATPTQSGEKVKTCKWCENFVTESYSLNLGQNYIYVENSNLQGKMAIASLTQSAVDNNDIVYSIDVSGSNNPFILGHNYGTMRHISSLNYGDIVYVCVNGVVKTYKVVISEYGLQNGSRTDIIGQSSGHSIWDNLGGETLHMYTCYGNNSNGRWMVLAIKV